MTVEILGRAGSINVRKVLWTGAELGCPVEREACDWRSPEYLGLCETRLHRPRT